jgi:hypothetical protein
MATVAQNITALYGDQTAARAAQDAATQRRSAPAAAAVLPCPEAAFSLTLKGLLDGQEAMLTVRGQTPEEFTANLQVVRGLFDRPTARQAESPAAPQAPATPAAAPQPDASLICPVHQVLMTRQSNARGSWLSHAKPEGGWCKGK